jgi:hypothetical protein
MRVIAELERIGVPQSQSRRIVRLTLGFNWQHAFWQPNYLRLRTVKTTYDPEGLLFDHHGVDSEEWGTDGFTRLT